MKLKSNFLSIFAVFALSMAATSTAWAQEAELHSVVVKPSEDGHAVASPTEAVAGATVSMNIYPDDGCYLHGLVIQDKDGNILNNDLNDFTGGEWYSGGVASFSMPNTNVFITPYFLPIEGRFLEMEMPATGTLSAIIPDVVDFFYIKKDYRRENGLIVLSAPEGKVLEISSVEQQVELEDSLYVYDGDNTNSTSLWASTTYDLYRLTSTGRYMTLNFKGNGYYHSKRGRFLVNVLDASETHDVTIENSEGGSVKASVGAASVNSTVILTATPDDGYMLDNIIVDYGEGLRVDVTGGAWYESGPISFKMPSSSVSVKPVFVPVNGVRSINMPRRGEVSVAIPEGVDSIKVYDDGGKDGSYSRITDGSLLLSAPEGKKLRIMGYAKLGSYYSSGTLNVYEKFDNGRNDSLMFYASYNKDNLKAITSGQNMRLDFKVSGYEYLEGINLTVTVVDPNAPHAINIVSVDNGSFINPPTEATPGTVVTLTASPNSGYFFNNVKIQDEYSTDSYEGNVDYTGGWYTNNTISFTMPQTEVTITPSFDYIQYADVVVKKSGTESISIPDEIKSFELNVGYSEDAIESSILLTAPEGKILQIQGEVAPRTGLDSLYVYDGADISATELLKVAASASVSKNSSGQNMLLHYMELGEDRGFGTGLSLRVSVVDPNHEYTVSIFEEIENGSVEVNKASAKFNTPVTVTATPAENYFLNKIEVRGKDSWNPVAVTGGTWYSSNEAIFAMPPEDAITRATFVNELSADAGLSITMPIYEPLRVTVPNGVESFTLEGDDLGEGVPSKPLILTAPNEYLLQINGNDSYRYGFNVYEGDVADPVGTGAEQTPGLVIGRTLTIVNLSSGECPYSIGVRLVQNEEHGIELAGINGDGNVSINPESGRAYGGDVVTLTATPAEGYVLSHIEAWWEDDDGDRHDIKVSGGTWYNNEASFVMPMATVYYEVHFVPSYYAECAINIPKTGNTAVIIPAGVPYLKVYDDNSGSYGAYSNNSDGSVTLTAPEGYSLAFMGEITTVEEADSLVVYDGSSTSAKKLLKVYGDKDIEPVYSSGRSLTFHFKSNAEWNDNGLDLYVVVLKKSSFGAVAVYSNGGFTLARIDGNYGGKDTVSIPDAVEVNAIEFVREFTPGLPATVVLPFSLPEGASVNAKFYQLESVEQEGRSWVANMRKIGKNTTPKANTPYVIIPEDSELQFEFSGTATLRTEKIEMTWSSDGNWYFTGAYVYRPWAENDEVLGLAYAFAGSNEDEVATGDFGRMGEGSYIVPMRAYLSKANSSIMLDPSRFGRPQTLSEMSSTELPENIDVKFMDEDDKVMAIGRMNTVTVEFNIERWYDLKGRSTNKMPTTKGAFYNKRVIVK